MNSFSLDTLLACMVWVSILYILANTLLSVRRGVGKIQELHSIPCTQCRYFTGDIHLKCPVNPKAALTEQAIDCMDFMGEAF